MDTTTALPEFDLELGGGGRVRRDHLLGRRTDAEVQREWRAVKAGGHAAAVLEAARSAS